MLPLLAMVRYLPSDPSACRQYFLNLTSHATPNVAFLVYSKNVTFSYLAIENFKETFTREASMEKILVPEGYRCPLCPDHEDDEFVWSNLLRCPICWPCTYDIHYGFDFDEQPTDDQYNHAGKIERIIEIMELSYYECRLEYQKETLEDLTRRLSFEESQLGQQVSREEAIESLRKSRAETELTIADIKCRMKRRDEIERWEEADVPEGYLCPLCGGGHFFCMESLFETLICGECSARISDCFEDPESQTEEDISFRQTISAQTGIPEKDIKLLILHETKEAILADREQFTKAEERRPYTERIRKVEEQIAALSTEDERPR